MTSTSASSKIDYNQTVTLDRNTRLTVARPFEAAGNQDDRLARILYEQQQQLDTEAADRLHRRIIELYRLVPLFIEYQHMERSSATTKVRRKLQRMVAEAGVVQPLSRWRGNQGRLSEKDVDTLNSLIDQLGPEHLLHQFRNWWQTEVNRPQIRQSPEGNEELYQEYITDKELNGSGGEYLFSYSLDKAQHPDFRWVFVYHHLRAMIIDRRNSKLSGRSFQALPRKATYSIEYRVGHWRHKLLVPAEVLLQENPNPQAFLEHIRSLQQSERMYMDDMHQLGKKPHIAKGRQGLLRFQDVTEADRLDPTKAGVADLIVNSETQENFPDASHVYSPHNCPNGANAPGGALNFAHNREDKVTGIHSIHNHAMIDGALALSEEKKVLASALATPDHIFQPQVRTGWVHENTSHGKSPETEQVQEAVVDVTALYQAMQEAYAPVQTHWQKRFKTGESSTEVGPELPVYQVFLYAMMMTLGLESAHQLVLDKQTQALVPNIVNLPKETQKQIQEWDQHVEDSDWLHNLRESFIFNALLTTVDKHLIESGQDNVGTGIVRALAVMSGRLRGITNTAAKFVDNNTRKLAQKQTLFSSLTPTNIHRIPGPDTDPGFSVDRFTTARTQTHPVCGIGAYARKNHQGRTEFVVTVREGPQFAGYDGDLQADIQANLEHLISFISEHLLPIAKPMESDSSDATEEKNDAATFGPSARELRQRLMAELERRGIQPPSSDDT